MLAIKVVELGRVDRNLSNEIERQKVLEKVLDCVFVRIISDEKKIYFQRNKQDTQTH